MTVTNGLFALGGELAQIAPVDEALAETGATRQRLRKLPARVVVYLLLAAALFEGGYLAVWRKFTAGLETIPLPMITGLDPEWVCIRARGGVSSPGRLVRALPGHRCRCGHAGGLAGTAHIPVTRSQAAPVSTARTVSGPVCSNGFVGEDEVGRS
ncbi:transposase domain-containing protein [Streptomyces nodosus]|uniref:transposase domain-containing protein n=1 Tax=Streptomyces nodosus TaxID=40318 RepID=UPI003F5171DD